MLRNFEIISHFSDIKTSNYLTLFDIGFFWTVSQGGGGGGA